MSGPTSIVPTVLLRDEMAELLSDYEPTELEVDSSMSHFHHPGKPIQHQTWPFGGIIGLSLPGSAFNVAPDLTALKFRCSGTQGVTALLTSDVAACYLGATESIQYPQAVYFLDSTNKPNNTVTPADTNTPNIPNMPLPSIVFEMDDGIYTVKVKDETVGNPSMMNFAQSEATTMLQDQDQATELLWTMTEEIAFYKLKQEEERDS